jgi:CRISPR system Cascade subunit CasB
MDTGPTSPLSETETKPKPADLAREWWKNIRENRGQRAHLRRARTLEEVVFLPAFHDLRRQLTNSDPEWNHTERLALVAAVLAHVDHNEPQASTAAQMALVKKGGSGPVISDLRFRRLLKLKTREQLLGPMIRLIVQLNRRANVPDLAESLYWWNERTRKRWALDYFEKLPTAGKN